MMPCPVELEPFSDVDDETIAAQLDIRPMEDWSLAFAYELIIFIGSESLWPIDYGILLISY